ncbi:MAG: PfkB family carbohydrate kinase [Candidatus Zixiibacteriota bacterium]
MVDCLGLGIAPADILMGIESYPKPGLKIDAVNHAVQGGGPVPTAMVTLARLGMKPALLAVVGDDLFGKFVINELKKERVDTSLIIEKKQPTAVASGWFEKDTGRRTIVLELNIVLQAKDIKLEALPRARCVHLDGRYLPACTKLAKWAKKNKIPIVLDVGSMRNDVSELLPLVDHMVCADAYAMPFTQTKTAQKAIEKLREYCNGTIVVTLGTRGSIGYANDEGFIEQKAYMVKTIDTTGAGDVYHGAYIFGLLNGYDLKERMRFGAIAAAIKCTRPGGRLGIPTLKQVRDFIRKAAENHA